MLISHFAAIAARQTFSVHRMTINMMMMMMMMMIMMIMMMMMMMMLMVQVDYVNAHGTSTKKNDQFETVSGWMEGWKGALDCRLVSGPP